jgi:N-methylhydantoinase B
VTTAWGLFGGKAGLGPEVIINPGCDSEKRFLKINAFPMKKGDIIRISTGGGGGFGSPLERDPNLVLNDVIDEYVTSEDAFLKYGVVFTKDLTVDLDATKTQREKMAGNI